MLRAVVFDIGGVLLEWDPGLVYRELLPDPADVDRFLAEIFAVLRRRFDLDPAETLVVDDLEANVAGARAAGFLAHRFVDAPGLAAILREYGLDV